MRAVIQRVESCYVEINKRKVSEIGSGLLVFLAIESADDFQDINWLVRKILNLRILSDKEGKMNCSVKELGAKVLIVSQFTLFAKTKKGNRPSFIKSADHNYARELYCRFIDEMKHNYFDNKIKSGKFAADMKINLVNDGPVTILIDTKAKD